MYIYVYIYIYIYFPYLQRAAVILLASALFISVRFEP